MASRQQLVFRSAGLFNALALLLLTPAFGLTEALGLVGFGSGLYDQFVAATIAAFGIGYWRAGDDWASYRGVIQLGTGLKLCVFFLSLAHWLDGALPARMVLLAGGDLIYAAIFIAYLYRRPAGAQQS